MLSPIFFVEVGDEPAAVLEAAGSVFVGAAGSLHDAID
jgi:uracil-DNA glycosylase